MQVSTTTMPDGRLEYRTRNVIAFQEMLGGYRACFSWDEAVALYEDYVSKNSRLPGRTQDDALAALRLASEERGWGRVPLND